MNKAVFFGKESREKLLEGVKKISKAVAVTMGAAGRNVLIGESMYQDGWLVPLPNRSTKDGWTVAKHFELTDPIENRGALLIKEAALKTVYEAGDATTCTCVLAEALITGGMKLIDEGANPQELKKGIDAAVDYVLTELKKISTPVRGDIERVRQVATVSANNDKVIGDLIASAFEKIGFDGVIDIERGSSNETIIKISEGLKIERGWVSPLFMNKPAKEMCEFENPFILLYEKKINHHTQIQKAVEAANSTGKPLLIICEDAEGEGLAFLAMNNYHKKIQACVIKCPEFGEARREWMEDIAMLTGAIYISDIRGVDIKKATQKEMGKAKKVIVTKNETVIIEGNGDKNTIEEFLNDLKMNLTQAKDEDEKAAIEKHIARLTGGVAVIQVGGVTETELFERMDRVDDAVRATKAAISEGFVPGGGTAFAKISMSEPNGSTPLDDTGIIVHWNKNKFGKGGDLVANSIITPFCQICSNAGIPAEQIIATLKVIKESNDSYGYNVLTERVEDMVQSGVIDSTKALSSALRNAASVAGMLLTTECSIITVS